MDKVLSIDKAIRIAGNLHRQGKKIVLIGGCFDILHIGHITFLRKAKEQGDVLFVLLESDFKIKRTKGKSRPINSQKDRAIILSEFISIGYIIPLPALWKDKDYDLLINLLKPDIIATTKGDPNIVHKERQAKMVKAKLVEVLERISDQSTSRLSKLIAKEIL